MYPAYLTVFTWPHFTYPTNIYQVEIINIYVHVLNFSMNLQLVMRHRQAKTKFAKRCTPVTLDDYSLDNISVFNSFRRKQRIRASKRSYTNTGFDDPVSIKFDILNSILKSLFLLTCNFYFFLLMEMFHRKFLECSIKSIRHS